MHVNLSLIAHHAMNYHKPCIVLQESLRPTIKKEEPHQKRCVHFYACICAFASDEALAEEFAYFINLDNCLTLGNSCLLRIGVLVHYKAFYYGNHCHVPQMQFMSSISVNLLIIY